MTVPPVVKVLWVDCSLLRSSLSFRGGSLHGVFVFSFFPERSLARNGKLPLRWEAPMQFPKSVWTGLANVWVWVKIKPPGHRKFWSIFPLTIVPFGVLFLTHSRL